VSAFDSLGWSVVTAQDDEHATTVAHGPMRPVFDATPYGIFGEAQCFGGLVALTLRAKGLAEPKHVAIGSYDGVYSQPEMQQRDEFEWDDDNEGKLAARHGVDRFEAEQAATDSGASIKRIGSDRVGNPEYIFVGKTEDGRILFIVGVRKSGGVWRIGSARDAKFQEKRAYRRRNR
jgi:uncharacterized DUF497 family protein